LLGDKEDLINGARAEYYKRDEKQYPVALGLHSASNQMEVSYAGQVLTSTLYPHPYRCTLPSAL